MLKCDVLTLNMNRFVCHDENNGVLANRGADFEIILVLTWSCGSGKITRNSEIRIMNRNYFVFFCLQPRSSIFLDPNVPKYIKKSLR